jgi:hypothetical protein
VATNASGPNAPFPRTARVWLYGLISVVVLTGLVLLILAREALA